MSIIEFKNYLLESLTKLCCKNNSKIISSLRQEDLFCEKYGCKFYKNGKTETGVQKNIYVLDAKIPFLKQLIQ